MPLPSELLLEYETHFLIMCQERRRQVFLCCINFIVPCKTFTWPNSDPVNEILSFS